MVVCFSLVSTAPQTRHLKSKITIQIYLWFLRQNFYKNKIFILKNVNFVLFVSALEI